MAHSLKIRDFPTYVFSFSYNAVVFSWFNCKDAKNQTILSGRQMFALFTSEMLNLRLKISPLYHSTIVKPSKNHHKWIISSRNFVFCKTSYSHTGPRGPYIDPTVILFLYRQINIKKHAESKYLPNVSISSLGLLKHWCFLFLIKIFFNNLFMY